jgi:hypothetical protein
MEDVDAAMREAKIGAATSSQVDNAAQASGTPGGDPELKSVEVTVQGSDADDAKSKLTDALPDGASIEVLG